MKAIFEAKKPYHFLMKGEVNNKVSVMGQAYIKGVYFPTGEPAGTKITTLSLDSYIFQEGEEHNQLTLTDPVEIENMRKYIKDRKDDFITEILFEK